MNVIDKIESPTLEFFVENYLKPNKPVLISGVTDKWLATSKWNAHYLSELSGERTLNISSMSDGDYVSSEDKNMTMKDYIDALNKMTDTSAKLYLGELSISKYLPELMDDIKIPNYFDKTEDSPQCFLYVGKSLFSQLHFHSIGSATLSPVHGYKKVRLYAPDQTRYLYKFPWYSKNHNMSRTTELIPDSNLFPKFSKAKYMDVTVSKGEMLFIPIYWWHAITNEDFNIAVVTFWGEKLFRRLPPSSFVLDYIYEISKETPEIITGITKKILRMIGLSK